MGNKLIITVALFYSPIRPAPIIISSSLIMRPGEEGRENR